MGILCFGWYIFHVHNSETVLYADDFFRTLFCYWVCWTYILLMIVLLYFRLSITNQICLLYNIFFLLFYMNFGAHFFLFYRWIMIVLVFYKIKKINLRCTVLSFYFCTWTLWIVVVELFCKFVSEIFIYSLIFFLLLTIKMCLNFLQYFCLLTDFSCEFF